MDGWHRNWHCGASGADTRLAAFGQEVVSSDGLQVSIVWLKITGVLTGMDNLIPYCFVQVS